MAERLTSFTNDGLQFDVRDCGPLDGDVVVLLHGFPQDSRSWERLVPLLNARGYRTLAPDQRGYSPGARPKHVRDYRLSVLDTDTAALIDQVGRGPVHLVGHDWGAAAAWSFAAARPDLLRTVTALSVAHPMAFVRSMVTPSQARKSWYMFAIQMPMLPELALSSVAQVERGLVSAGLSPRSAHRDALAMRDRGRAHGALNWYRAMPLVSPRRASTKVTVPTLHIWSDGDQFVTRKSAELTPRYMDAPYRFEVLHGVSHWIPDEAPEQVDALLAEHFQS